MYLPGKKLLRRNGGLGREGNGGKRGGKGGGLKVTTSKESAVVCLD